LVTFKENDWQATSNKLKQQRKRNIHNIQELKMIVNVKPSSSDSSQRKQQLCFHGSVQQIWLFTTILFGLVFFLGHGFIIEQQIHPTIRPLLHNRFDHVITPTLATAKTVKTAKFMFDGGGSGDDGTSSGSGSSEKRSGGISGGLQLQTLQKELSKLDKKLAKIDNPLNAVLEELEEGNVSLPFTFEMKDKGYSPKTRTIQVRQMEMDDVQKCVGLCLKEYGNYGSPATKSNANSIMGIVQSKMDDLDNFVFSFVVLLGLEQRVTRRMKSESTPQLEPDHNVVILSEIKNGDGTDSANSESERIFGMAEISLQPPDPSRTSPPFVIPTNVKKVMSNISSATSSSKKPLCAYVSNVLITNEYRSKGFSKVLMSTCHGLARSWGFSTTYLHVDADANAGRAAQQLYRKLGYSPYVDKTFNEKFAWMGIDMMNRGLYIVDGVPLLFLKKDL
jgi:hypothetical protein